MLTCICNQDHCGCFFFPDTFYVMGKGKDLVDYYFSPEVMLYVDMVIILDMFGARLML